MFVPTQSQDMRECRWCQPQFRAQPSGDEDLANAPWECVRLAGQEQPVSEDMCARCEHWEPDYTF